jgi:hypothetical protein
VLAPTRWLTVSSVEASPVAIGALEFEK